MTMISARGSARAARTLAAAILTLAPAFAVAQSTTASTTAPAESSGPLQSLSAARQQLKNAGVDMFAYYQGVFYANVSGGEKRADIYSSDVGFGGSLDLDKLVGIPGGSLDVQFDSRFGGMPQGVNDLTGSGVGFLGGIGPDNHTRLTTLTFGQSFANGALSYVVGRTTLANYFGTSSLYCQFETSLCSNLVPFNWSLNSNEPFYPISVWAGELEVTPSKLTYIKFGASESNPEQYSGGGFPWNGGWSVSTATGVFIPVEFGYSNEDTAALYPGRYDVGYYYDSSQFTDPRYNTEGGKLALVGGAPKIDGPQSTIYLQAQKVLWRSGNEKDARKLWGFAAAQFGLSGHEPVKTYFQLGAVMQGTFPGRPNDTAGVLATYYVFNPRVTGSVDDEIVADGKAGHVSNTEEIFEVNYGIDLGHGINIKPYIDLTVNPDQFLFDVTPNPKNRYAVAVGSQLNIQL
ncbi:MAG TPA: carbohydrate porin [Acidiphilium sp.]